MDTTSSRYSANLRQPTPYRPIICSGLTAGAPIPHLMDCQHPLPAHEGTVWGTGPPALATHLHPQFAPCP